MYKSKTVYVIGAGAGVDIGMPTGNKLIKTIKQLLDFPINNSNWTDQTTAVYLASRSLSKNEAGNIDHLEAKKYVIAAQSIKGGLDLATSIDNFVHSRQDSHVTALAKLAITQSILDAERKSILYPVPSIKYPPEISFSNLSKSWLPLLMKSLNDGLTIDQLGRIFENLTFINFNYDRVLEFFLASAISRYYAVSDQQAQEIVNGAQIYHPYGTVGRLPWQPGSQPEVGFGAEDGYSLNEVSLGIKTFTERIEDQSAINEIRNSICSAQQIIFMGFGFHDQNMELLQPPISDTYAKIIASAYGISDSDCSGINSSVLKLCVTKYPPSAGRKLKLFESYIIDNQATCFDVMNKYQRTIRA